MVAEDIVFDGNLPDQLGIHKCSIIITILVTIDPCVVPYGEIFS